jgi:predicted nucleic acid-binding protein
MASDPRYGATSSKILRRIEEKEISVTSTLVILQVSAYLKWKKKANIIPIFFEFLQSLPNLTKIETSFSDFIEAKRLQQVNWSQWDALVIAMQMKRSNVSEIYSNDSDFDLIPGIKRFFE